MDPQNSSEKVDLDKLSSRDLALVEVFVARVNARAEAEILASRIITGAHHRAMEAELSKLRAAGAITEG